jgi:hypothetical protein
VNQGQNQVFEVDSGEAGVCDWSDIPWLTASPATGTIPAGQGATLTLNFNSTGLPVGVYQAQLKLPNNTPYGTKTIAVTMRVTNYGVSLTPASVALSGRPGSHVTYELTVANTGAQADTFNLSVSGASWQTTLSQSSIILASGASAKITVTVTIPVGSPFGLSDDVTITATSQGDPGVTDSSILVTSVNGRSLFLPIIKK